MIRGMLLCPLLVGCAAKDATVRDPRLDASPFVQTVPGSTVKFTMRPVTTWDDDQHPRVIWFAETETTWDAYDVFFLRPDETRPGPVIFDGVTRPTFPYSPPDLGWGHGGYPVIGVTFNAATAYCQWLSERTGRRYRLPTAAEWRDATWLSCGSSAPDPRASAWLADNSPGETTHPVARLAANHYGLFDLIGNVAEWCVGDDGKPVVVGGSFATDVSAMSDEDVDRTFLRGESQTRAWNANDAAFPKSRWWLSDAPFVGFRVVCEEGPR